MGDSGKHGNNTNNFLNPGMLQFQKMGLELTCPLCLNLFKRPKLFPCNHIFCSPCIGDRSRPSCAVCKIHYAREDLRRLPIVENMVGIYQSLDAFYPNLSQNRSRGILLLPPAESQGLQQAGMDKNKGTILDQGKKKNKGTLREVGPTRYTYVAKCNCRTEASSCTGGCAAISATCLNKVMEALADRNTHLIGVSGSDKEFKDISNDKLRYWSKLEEDLKEKVCRKVDRDKLFVKVLTVTVTKKPDVKKIQKDIARELDYTFDDKSKKNRALQLIEKLKTVQKILIILRDLHKRLDWGTVGIPYGTDHTGCKILLTSPTEDVLSNQMQTQSIFKIVAPP